jgi:hypothetical protein
VSQVEPVQIDLGDGVVAVVEAHVSGDAGGEQDVVSLTQTFETVSRSIREISARLLDAVRAVSPEKATLELGFDLSMENGALVAFLVKGTSSATIKVTLEWDRKAPPPPPPPPPPGR